MKKITFDYGINIELSTRSLLVTIHNDYLDIFNHLQAIRNQPKYFGTLNPCFDNYLLS